MAVALVVNDMITTSVSFEQAQVEASDPKLGNIPDFVPVLQMPQGAEGGTSPRRFNLKRLVRAILHRTLLWKNTLMSLLEHSLHSLGFPFFLSFIMYFL